VAAIKARQSITIYDLAKVLGLSAATVSRALQNSPLVKEETRSHVQEAARRLGYRPNSLARSLTTGRTRTIGMLVGDVVNAFYPELIDSVQLACDQRGYSLVLGSTREDPLREEQTFHLLLQQQVDGVIICSPRSPDDVLAEWARALPVILLNRTGPDGVPAVSVDNRKGGYMAASHLIARGARRLLYLGGPQTAEACRRREEGVQAAVSEAGAEIVCRYAPARPEAAQAIVQSLFADGARPFDAIAAYDDVMAAGVIRGLLEAGVQVPREVSVTGFDDVTLSRLVTPSLTTVRQPLSTMAALALDLLLSAIGGAQTGDRVQLEPALVVRQSAPPGRVPAPRPQ
jgi:LacI family transcriptional regulator